MIWFPPFCWVSTEVTFWFTRLAAVPEACSLSPKLSIGDCYLCPVYSGIIHTVYEWSKWWLKLHWAHPAVPGPRKFLLLMWTRALCASWLPCCTTPEGTNVFLYSAFTVLGLVCCALKVSHMSTGLTMPLHVEFISGKANISVRPASSISPMGERGVIYFCSSFLSEMRFWCSMNNKFRLTQSSLYMLVIRSSSSKEECRVGDWSIPLPLCTMLLLIYYHC